MGHRLKQTIVVWCDNPGCNRSQEYPGDDLKTAMYRAAYDGWQVDNGQKCFRCANEMKSKQETINAASK